MKIIRVAVEKIGCDSCVFHQVGERDCYVPDGLEEAEGYCWDIKDLNNHEFVGYVFQQEDE